MCPLACPNLFLPQLLIIAAILFSIYGYRRMHERARSNIDSLSRLLQAPSPNSGFFRPSIEGYYKGRKVVLAYSLSSKSYNFLNPFMEPRIPLKKQKLFLIDYPKITEHTQLRGGRIYYNCRLPIGKIEASNWSWGGIRIFSEGEFRDILEELTQAAQIVESNPENF